MSTSISASASTSNPPTFLLVPGHWHTPTHLAPLTQALTARNLPTRTLQLHTVGRKPLASPRPTYSDDVSVIYTAVIHEILAGRDVVLVLHSYAGMPGAEAVNCLVKDGVVEGASSGRPDSGVQMMPAANVEDGMTEKGVKRMGALVRVVFIAAYIFPAKAPIDPKDFVGPENPGFSIDVRPATPAPLCLPSCSPQTLKPLPSHTVRPNDPHVLPLALLLQRPPPQRRQTLRRRLRPHLLRRAHVARQRQLEARQRLRPPVHQGQCGSAGAGGGDVGLAGGRGCRWLQGAVGQDTCLSYAVGESGRGGGGLVGQVGGGVQGEGEGVR